MTFLRFVVFAAGWGACFIWLVIFIIGMGFNDGVVTLDMNSLNEGWWEMGLFTVLTVVYPFALWSLTVPKKAK